MNVSHPLHMSWTTNVHQLRYPTSTTHIQTNPPPVTGSVHLGSHWSDDDRNPWIIYLVIVNPPPQSGHAITPHWDDVQWPWSGSIPQRSRLHKTFKGQSTHARVRAITSVCIDGLPLGTNVVLIETMCVYPRLFRLPIKQRQGYSRPCDTCYGVYRFWYS